MPAQIESGHTLIGLYWLLRHRDRPAPASGRSCELERVSAARTVLKCFDSARPWRW